MKHMPRPQRSEACRGRSSPCRKIFTAWSLSHSAVADHAGRRDRSITFDRLQVWHRQRYIMAKGARKIPIFDAAALKRNFKACRGRQAASCRLM